MLQIVLLLGLIVGFSVLGPILWILIEAFDDRGYETRMNVPRQGPTVPFKVEYTDDEKIEYYADGTVIRYDRGPIFPEEFSLVSYVKDSQR